MAIANLRVSEEEEEHLRMTVMIAIFMPSLFIYLFAVNRRERIFFLLGRGTLMLNNCVCAMKEIEVKRFFRNPLLCVFHFADC